MRNQRKSPSLNDDLVNLPHVSRVGARQSTSAPTVRRRRKLSATTPVSQLSAFLNVSLQTL